MTTLTLTAPYTEHLAHDLPEPAPYCSCPAGVYAEHDHDTYCAHAEQDGS